MSERSELIMSSVPGEAIAPRSGAMV